jgi:hypothetical protein
MMESDLIGLNQFFTSIGFWTFQIGMGFISCMVGMSMGDFF